MKKLENTKHHQILFLNGKNQKSMRCYEFEKEKVQIEAYEVLFWSGNSDDDIVRANQDTEHQFGVLLEESKVRAVIKFQNQEFALKQQDVTQERVILEGFFIILWREKRVINNVHLLWAEGGSKRFKNINLEAYNYRDDEIWEIFQRMFLIMIEGLPNIQKESFLGIWDQKAVSESGTAAVGQEREAGVYELS